MPIPSTIALAYCADDQSFADRIEKDLGSLTSFRHFQGDNENDGTALSDQLANFSGPTILLVSDNFLRNPNCMHHANRLLSSRAGAGNNTQAVLLEIERYDEQIGETVQVPANVARQADIMNYINHWQERYLDLRRQKSALSEEIGASFDQYLAKIREVSGQVNDFLHYLKDSMPLRFNEFTTDRYRQFFIFLDAENSWNSFSLPVATPKVVTPTPEPTPAPVEPPVAPPVPDPVEDEIKAPTTTPAPEPEVETEAVDNEKLIQRAWSMADDGEWQTGLDLLRSGVNTYPENQDLSYHLALMLATEADEETEARQILNQILKSNPGQQDALFLSGELHLAEGKHAAARENWESLADLNPAYPDLSQELGLLMVKHYPKEPMAALELLKAATKAESEEAEVYFYYGRLAASEMNSPTKAVKALKKAVELAPDNATAIYELARQQHACGHYKVALQNYHRATDLDPKFLSPENEKAFAPPAKQKPRFMTENEAGALSALKENIAQLEALIQEREAAAEAADQQAQQALLEARIGHGKLALISGATAGIGLATAHRLAQDGYRLILTGRRGDRLEAIANELREAHESEILTLTFDVRDAAATQSAIEGLGDDWSAIDVLINNAGKAKGLAPIHEGELEHWNEMIDVNLKGLLYLTRAVTPGMVARKNGFVLNICSTAGKEVYPNGNVYCATKHAVDALTASMRLDLVEHGVKVGQICPAHVEETEFAEVRFDGDKKKAKKVYKDFQPLVASDVAEAVAFMLSRPEHVNVLDIVLQGKQQASSTVIDRSGRNND